MVLFWARTPCPSMQTFSDKAQQYTQYSLIIFTLCYTKSVKKTFQSKSSSEMDRSCPPNPTSHSNLAPFWYETSTSISFRLIHFFFESFLLRNMFQYRSNVGYKCCFMMIFICDFFILSVLSCCLYSVVNDKQ